MEDGTKEPSEPAPEPPTISEAVERFLADAEHGRKLTNATLKKYRGLLTQLKTFAGQCAAVRLSEIDVDFARQFRASWKDGAISSVKKLERFSAFCRFLMLSGWIPSNPAASVAKPVVRQSPTLPFTAKEVNAILEKATDPRWHALIQVLRWAGLRIGDAMGLTEDKLHGSRLLLRTAKTGVAVFVPLPQFVVNELAALPKYGGFFFWRREKSESKIETAAGNARRTLRNIFNDAGVKHAHPHRFRDSFAVGLLENGVSIEVVATLLGHTDIRITQKHYAPWVRSRQENLEREVSTAWPQAKLVRVK